MRDPVEGDLMGGKGVLKEREGKGGMRDLMGGGGGM